VMRDDAIIKFEKVNFSYGGTNVLENISFSIKRGDFVGIIGPNGSGKTTLLRMILNLLDPESGNVQLFDTPISKFNNWNKIGYVPQKVTQLETKFPITVNEVISLGRVSNVGLFGKLKRRDKRAISHAESIIDISTIKNKLITELSGGQQQRVFIAKALASEPEVLILDEPTTGVDLESQEAFYNLLTKLNKERGLTIILVSHDVGVIVNEVKTIFCINRSLIYRGSPQGFTQSDHIQELYGKGRKFFLHGHQHV